MNRGEKHDRSPIGGKRRSGDQKRNEKPSHHKTRRSFSSRCRYGDTYPLVPGGREPGRGDLAMTPGAASSVFASSLGPRPLWCFHRPLPGPKLRSVGRFQWENGVTKRAHARRSALCLAGATSHALPAPITSGVTPLKAKSTTGKGGVCAATDRVAEPSPPCGSRIIRFGALGHFPCAGAPRQLALASLFCFPIGSRPGGEAGQLAEGREPLPLRCCPSGTVLWVTSIRGSGREN